MVVFLAFLSNACVNLVRNFLAPLRTLPQSVIKLRLPGNRSGQKPHDREPLGWNFSKKKNRREAARLIDELSPAMDCRLAAMYCRLAVERVHELPQDGTCGG